MLQSQRDGDWHDLYAFTLEPQLAVDYEIANHYVSTHPRSRFVQILTVQLPHPERCQIMRDRELFEDRGASVRASSRTLADEAELLQVLRQTFGLEFPPGTRFVKS